MRKEVIGNATLYLGDCREILPMLNGLGDGRQNPDVSVERGGGADIALPTRIVVTDPPWDQAKGIPGAEDPRGLFSAVAPHLAAHRLVAVQLGCYTDPCFVAPLASRMKFLHTCWLRYVPPSYNGRILVDADVAYVYGVPPASRPGARVLPSQCQSTAREPSEKEFLRRHGKNRTSEAAAATTAAMSHPMPRCLAHVRWLVRWHSEESDTVLDPFLGSGTTGVAALVEGRKFIGIEIHEPFFDLACERVEEAQRQERLFA